jgi:hypothetical protein
MKPYPNLLELERLSGVTWQDLVELEPRLGDLLWRAPQAGARCLCWADVDRLFPPIHNTLVDLVGFDGHHHTHPVLGSAWAYEVAYWKLYDAVAGLLPVPAGSAADPEKQRGEPVSQTCPTEAAAMSTAGI